MKHFTLEQLYKTQTNDLVFQALAVALPVLFAVFTEAGVLLLAYGTVAFVQFLSCIIYFLKMPREARNKARGIYECIVSIIFLLGIFFLIFPGKDWNDTPPLIYMGVLVLSTPFFAVWYFIMVYRERSLVGEAIRRKEIDEFCAALSDK